MIKIFKEIARTIATNVTRLPVRDNLGRVDLSQPSVFGVNNNPLLTGKPDNTRRYIDDAFSVNSTVYAITTAIARKFGSIPVHVYRKTSDDAMKQYKAASDYALRSGDPLAFSKAIKLRAKALTPVPESDSLYKLIHRPNPLQGASSFFENLMLFKLVTGAGVVWANRPTGKEPFELWILPSQDIYILVDNFQYMLPSGYRLQVNYISDLPLEDVLYWKYANLRWDTMGSHLYGLSPLKAAMLDVDDDQAGKKASLMLKENQGAKGVIYRNDPVQLSPEQRDRLKQTINENVNGKYNKGRVEISNVGLGYINLGMTSEDMGVIQSRSITKEDLANVFQFPIPLLSGAQMTLANYETAVRALVTQCTMPEWASLRDDLNNWLPPMYGPNTGYWVEPDFGQLPEMQKNLREMGIFVKSIWQLSPNQVLDYLGFESDPDNEAMNAVYIPSGYTKIDDVFNGAADMGAGTDMLNDQNFNDYNNSGSGDASAQDSGTNDQNT